MSVELKIKSKHLGEEARIIRFEENKIKRHAQHVRERQGHVTAEEVMKTFRSLANHRKWDVRNENRATFLARAYIAGVPYKTVEQKRKDESVFNAYIVPRIISMVAKYGAPEDRIYKKWNNEAKRYEFDADQHKALKDKIKEWSTL